MIRRQAMQRHQIDSPKGWRTGAALVSAVRREERIGAGQGKVELDGRANGTEGQILIVIIEAIWALEGRESQPARLLANWLRRKGRVAGRA